MIYADPFPLSGTIPLRA